jgi:hypothetical protein
MDAGMQIDCKLEQNANAESSIRRNRQGFSNRTIETPPLREKQDGQKVLIDSGIVTSSRQRKA